MESSPADSNPTPTTAPRRSVGKAILALISGPAALIGTSTILGIILLLIKQFNPDWTIGLIQGEDERIFNVVVSAIIYIASLAGMWVFLGRYLFPSTWPPLKALAADKPLTANNAGLAVLAFAGYFVTLIVVLAFASQIPGFNLTQSQDVGQSQPHMLSAYIIAFIGLVVLPPVFEELIFRGFMFGALRRQAPFWVSAVLVSLAFGLVHWQVNVSTDTFVLSLFLCALRERTGTIWPSMIVHAMKNGVAFMYLFFLSH